MLQLEITAGTRRWRSDPACPVDIAIPLEFRGDQPRFFAVQPAWTEPLRAGTFSGEVASGASCNCSVHTLAPHCHGTHTECVGHVTSEPVSVSSVTPAALAVALLVSVKPQPLGDAARQTGSRSAATDLVVTAPDLARSAAPWNDVPWTALVVRTLPNEPSKRHRAYAGASPAPYYATSAMQWIVDRGVTSLVVDVPSLDRADDGGQLAAHRTYWGLPPGAREARLAQRPHALVTELAYVPDDVPDGPYLLDLQVAAFVADAAPSRPVLYRLAEAG
jgi:arylformamidase